MIRHIRGTLLTKSETAIILDVGGVGYHVFVPPGEVVKSEGEEVSLWTHLAVREDSMALYGFQSTEKLDFFELLLSVSGVGPKSALGILSIAGVRELKMAARENNPSLLTKISGIGKKTAEKIVLELRDKIEAVAGESEGGTSAVSVDSEAIDALVALGYSTNEAREALRSTADTREGEAAVEIEKDTGLRVRDALKYLGS